MKELRERYRLALCKMKEMNELERNGKLEFLTNEELLNFRMQIASHVAEVRIIWCCLAQMKASISDVTEGELLDFLRISKDERFVFSSLTQ